MSEALFGREDLSSLPHARLSGAVGSVTGISIDTRTLAPATSIAPFSASRRTARLLRAAFDKPRRPASRGEPRGRIHGGGSDRRRPGRARLAGRSRASRPGPHGSPIVAVTGSVGKTGTKDALRHDARAVRVDACGRRVVQQSLGRPGDARAPARLRALRRVFEIGMNHPGEIVPLTAMVRPRSRS